MTLRLETRELPSGIVINNRYRVVTKLGQGGMGRVYLVVDTLHGARQVALKTMRADLPGEDLIGIFSHEFEALTKLKHPNLVEVYDFGEIAETGELFFTLEYVSGRNMYQATRGMSPEGILDYLVQVCRALEYIHSRGLIHHDVKPENILVFGTRGAGAQVKLMDFGLSLEEDLAGQQGQVRGTLHYLAPEIAAGDPYDRRSDLYSLGIVLYRLLRDRLPLEDMPTSQLAHFGPIPRPPDPDQVDLSPPFRRLLRRLVAPNPATRFSSANEIIREINELFGTEHALETKETTAGYILSGRFVGRQHERARLAEIQAELVISAPGTPFLLFGGEAGIGKRRLLREWRVAAQVAGIAFIEAACYEDVAVPYGPVGAVLRQVVALVGPDSALVSRHRDALARVVRGLGESQAPEAPGPRERRRLIASLTQFLIDAGTKRRLILAFHDLQWADSETIELLRYLVRTLHTFAPEPDGDAPRRPSLCVCGTYRRGEMPGTSLESAVAELDEDGFVEHHELGRLADEEVAELLGSMLGIECPPIELARQLAEQTDGNPYFLEELMKQLLEDNLLRRTGSHWDLSRIDVDRLVVPASCGQVIRRRLARLDPPAREVLEVLSVIGRPAGLPLLRALIEGQPGPTVGLRQLERLNLLAREVDPVEGQRFRPSQTATRGVVYRSLPDGRRRALHRSVAAALEAMAGDDLESVVVELAHHHIRGGNREPAIAFGIRAADQSATLNANQRAISLYDDVLALLDRDDLTTRRQVVSALADLQRTAGQYGTARRYYEEALGLTTAPLERADLMRRLGDTAIRQGEYPLAVELWREAEGLLGDAPGSDALRAELLVGNGRVDELTGEYDNGIEKARMALALDPPESIAVQAYQLLGNLSWCVGRYDEAIDHYQRAMSIEQARGNVRGLAASYNNLALVNQDLGQTERALELYQQSLEHWQRNGDPGGVALCYSNLGTLHRDRGEYTRSVQYHRDALQIFERLGDRTGIARASECLGEVYTDLGRWTESERCFQRCLEICDRIGNLPLSIYAYLNLGESYAGFGALDAAEEHAERAIELARGIQARMLIGAGLLLQGDVRRRRLDWESAHALLEEAHAIFVDLGNRPEQVKAASLLACLYHEMGEEEVALSRAESALDDAGRLGNREQQCGLLHLCGVIHHARGRLDRARDALDEAYLLATGLGKRDLLWKLRHDSGRLRFDEADFASAREEYMEAVELGKQIWDALPAPLKEQFLGDPRHRRLSKDIARLRDHLTGDAA